VFALSLNRGLIPRIQPLQGLKTGTPVTARSFVFRVTSVRFPELLPDVVEARRSRGVDLGSAEREVAMVLTHPCAACLALRGREQPAIFVVLHERQELREA
jgi:hypothetical protein